MLDTALLASVAQQMMSSKRHYAVSRNRTGSSADASVVRI